jgi:hypothetical protein
LVERLVQVQIFSVLAAWLLAQRDWHGQPEKAVVDMMASQLERLVWDALAPAQGAAHLLDQPSKLPEVLGRGFHLTAAVHLCFPTSSA